MKNTCRILLVICLGAIVATAFSGCEAYYAKLDQKRILQAQTRNPSLHRDNCLKSYPPTRSSKDSIRIIPGKTDTFQNYVTIDCDSVVKNRFPSDGGMPEGRGGKKAIVKIPCPPSTHTTDTFTHYSTIIEQDTRAIDQWSEKYFQANEETIQLTQQKKTWRMVALSLSALIALVLIGKFFLSKLSFLKNVIG